VTYQQRPVPVYIASKGRADVATTPLALDRMGVTYRIVVEDFEHDKYAARYGEHKVIVMPQRYIDDYDPVDDRPAGTPKGSGPPRNFALDHALESGHQWCWSIDDNILYFGWLHNNRRIPTGDSMIFDAMDEFVQRYENIGLAGPEYWWFVKARSPQAAPFVVNRRVMSCYLMRTDNGIRWRSRYNEDIVFAIANLRAGWCTVNFRVFLQFKLRTQTMPGGLHKDFYSHEPGGGTLWKAQQLVKMHPDVARLQWRFGRMHHWCDWSQFEDMHLIRRADWTPDQSGHYSPQLIDAGVTVRPRKADIAAISPDGADA
jgi:hypothetical protein